MYMYCRSGKIAVTKFFFTFFSYLPMYAPGEVSVYVRRVPVVNLNQIMRGISSNDGVTKTLAPSERKRKKQL
jgi:hypothetical protein